MQEIFGLIRIRSTYINPEAISLIFYNEEQSDLNLYIKGFLENEGRMMAQGVSADDYAQFTKDYERALKERKSGSSQEI